jgi:hypothetical protein
LWSRYGDLELLMTVPTDPSRVQPRYVKEVDLAVYGIMPADVRPRYPWATEYTDLDGGPCWLAEDVAEVPNARGGGQ